MATRCNVLVKDKYSQQWFYRHNDGYPSVTANSLKTLIQWLVDGKIRDNVCQGGSWLIIIGNNEDSIPDSRGSICCGGRDPSKADSFNSWKVGAYELTDQEHGDIEWLYTIDMSAKTVAVRGVFGGGEEKVYSYEEFLKEDFKK